MDHVGVVVDDLEAAIAFLVELGLELGPRRQSRDVGWTASSGSTVSESTSPWCGPRMWREAGAPPEQDLKPMQVLIRVGVDAPAREGTPMLKVVQENAEANDEAAERVVAR